MKLLILEPYFTGSHAAWATGLAQFSRHDVEILQLPGQFWKWRMHGAAVTMAREFNQKEYAPDLILATDMLDLTTFLALTREKAAGIPVAVYFHENQLTYPWSENDRDILHKRDKHYGFINYASALAADAVFFNSDFHRRSFLKELPRLLKHFPDFQELESVDRIEIKSRVLPLGFDFEKFESHRPEAEHTKEPEPPATPLILWNHRWEYDKNPAEFFAALNAVMDKGLEFEVALLGENFSQYPEEFEKAKAKLGRRLVQFGFAEDFADYARWLFRADLLPVTSLHDFFGISAVEAVYCGCYPLLPPRLSYPEIFPPSAFRFNYYQDLDELVVLLTRALDNIQDIRRISFRPHLEKYSWKYMAPLYDREFAAVLDLKMGTA
jgi:glycosyltransferase involved in cell wall biosynthesis